MLHLTARVHYATFAEDKFYSTEIIVFDHEMTAIRPLDRPL
jgi:hypothetical protein